MPPTLAPIVLVEDDPNDVLFIRHALQHARIENPVVVFSTATEAQEQILSPSYTAAIPVLFMLDMHLPGGLTGLEFLRWLRQQGLPVASTPAMMLTGSDRDDHRAESRRLGANVYLQKPVTEERLTEAVQALGFVVVTNLVSGQMGFRIIERR